MSNDKPFKNSSIVAPDPNTARLVFGGIPGALQSRGSRIDFWTALKAATRTCDPHNRRQYFRNMERDTWHYPTGPYERDELERYIEVELFKKLQLANGATLEEETKVRFTPVPLINDDDYYCIIEENGSEYVVCYHTFALSSPDGLLLSFKYPNDRTGLLTVQFQFAVPEDKFTLVPNSE